MRKKQGSNNNWLIAFGFFAILMIGSYAVVYQLEPFREWVNDLLTNLITNLAALVCALLATGIVFCFEPGEPPRRVWIWYATALWMWMVAEVIWSIYNLLFGEVPAFSAPDFLWMAAYLFFALALSRQFGLILFDRSQRPLKVGLAILSAVGLIPGFITVFTGGGLGEFAGYFYPIADFAMGLAALILFISFRGGILAWPWISLLGFTLSDSLYTWAVTNDAYGWTTGGGLLSLLIDLTYVFAYLLLAWGLLTQYRVLRSNQLRSDG